MDKRDTKQTLPKGIKGERTGRMKRLRFFLMTLILCIGVAILTVGLSTADLFSKAALDNPDRQVAFAFLPTHDGLSVTLFNDSFELKYPGFLQTAFEAVSGFFVYARDGASGLAVSAWNGIELLECLGSFLNYLRDRIV